jgi:hypothetical protein
MLIATSSIILAGEKISPRLATELHRLQANDIVYVWVYFVDKGENEELRASIPSSVVSERALRRRSKIRPQNSLVDYTDLPVSQMYIAQIEELVLRVRQRSKWFNMVSVIAAKRNIAEIEQLRFVQKIDLLARFRKNRSEERPAASHPQNAAQELQPPGAYSLDYGSSFGQVNQINVPAVHDLGYSGTGVFVGVFDNGFRLLTHESFATMNIHATYDFVDHKVSVVPNNPSTSFGSHGVNTLSTIGGYKPAQLIGPAYGATFLLARTENDSSERPIEEDNWVAAIEWADSIGVDVTSTSLGYLDYDFGYPSWTWEDMNGNTTVITRAADAAVARGIVVVNSAGNNGFNASHNTLNAPADGDSVLTIGAVTSTGTRSSFSSVGPTTSVPPRIKPDVMARGSSVVVANSTNTTGYDTTASGTSFSCPLAAGVAALVVQARPNATPIQIMNAMRNTASRSATPDNQYGWGILNALAAINSLPVPIQLNYLTATLSAHCVLVRWGTISEVNNYGFEVQRSPDGLTNIITIPNSFTPGNGTTNIPHHYEFLDCTAPTGALYYRLKQIDLDGSVNLTDWIQILVPTSVRVEKPVEFALHQNYPNPLPAGRQVFNPTTHFRFAIADFGVVMLKVFDILGREVSSIVNREMGPGSYDVEFNGGELSGGVYFCTLQSGSKIASRKFLVLK